MTAQGHYDEMGRDKPERTVSGCSATTRNCAFLRYSSIAAVCSGVFSAALDAR